ncbi:MAG: PEP-CTERM system histidine kinase PrsK [Piscirickettsiaceae bacterium]|nr:MAG: PEP-CTERM system histidine kinase PrsK [Piscirickettsiaceae bacterium]
MNTILTASLTGHSLALLGFLVLFIMLTLSWKGRIYRSLLMTACFASMLWAGQIASLTLLSESSATLGNFLELFRNFSWLFFLYVVLQSHDETVQDEQSLFKISNNEKLFFIVVFLAILGFLKSENNPITSLDDAQFRSITLSIWVILSIAGLVLVEQVYRHAKPEGRWAIKHLCLGLGGCFAYDIFYYADALLFNAINPSLWAARGAVNVIAIPFIAISIKRNPKWNTGIHVSKQMLFHSFTIMGTGIYLLAMSGVGYALKYFGGDWGATIQAAFLFGAVSLLFLVLFSGKIRAKTQVFLSKHFYNLKYDYREEWLSFTKILSDERYALPDNCTNAISRLLHSPSGLMWIKRDQSHFDIISHWNMPTPESVPSEYFQPLNNYFEEHHWIIDLDEYKNNPSAYEHIDVPEYFLNIPDAWLLIPIEFNNQLIAIMLIAHSHSQTDLNWEDRDLIKMASFQVAVNLSQYETNRALTQARQFEAFNRLSVYIVHDLKNILGQLSLLIANAEKHKHKPAFVDDVISTVENSVNRMTSLMKQLRTGVNDTSEDTVELTSLLQGVVSSHSKRRPLPTLHCDNDLYISANATKFATVVGHIVQNAQEATDNNGFVAIQATKLQNSARIIIKDNGSGMDANFIENKLFSAFDSTKGLTGMGIGMFESREYIRKIGGNIQVTSSIGNGTTFTFTMPLANISE